MIIIVFGLPGSGKSYFASRLATKLGADYINTDRVRKELFSKPKYSSEEKNLTYKKVLDQVYSHAHSKKSLVVDGTFYQQGIRQNFIRLSEDLRIDMLWIEIVADESLIKDRVAQKRAYSDADFSIYLMIKKQFEPFKKGQYMRITSTNTNLAQMIHQVEQYLEREKKDEKGTSRIAY